MKNTPDGVEQKTGTIQQGDIQLSYTARTLAQSKALLLIVHGLNDHKGRYADLQEKLADAGYSSYAYDQRGFGLSGGKRADVAQYDDYHEDLKAVLSLMRHNCPEQSVILLGHSLGGLISATYCIKYPQSVDALVLSSPAYSVVTLPFRIELLGYLLYFFMPKLSIGYPSLAYKRSHDPDVINAVAADPLIIMEATPRFYIQFRKMNKFLQDQAGHIDVPILILQAGDDEIVHPEGAKVLYERLKNPEKKLIWYEGFYHEVFHEIERDKVIADLIEWLDDLCPRLKKRNGVT